MPNRQKPKTAKDMTDQIWVELIGTNGDGLIERFDKHLDDDFEHREQTTIAITGLTATVAGLSGKLDGHMGTARPSRGEINKQRLREVRVIATRWGVIVVCGLLVFFSLYFGLVKPDFIIEVISAWRGS